MTLNFAIWSCRMANRETNHMWDRSSHHAPAASSLGRWQSLSDVRTLMPYQTELV